LAAIPAPFALQVVVMEPVMKKLTGEKKDAKKLKKILYICREKDEYVLRCLQKAQSKKRWKKPLTGFL
jgi:bacterioferritin (cytochrome b1)